jgi:hypothetical protein
LDILDSWKSVVALVGLTTIIVLGIVWIHHLRKDARGEETDETPVRFESLREAYESGQMSDSEFERIRTSLGVPPDRWPDLKRRKPAPTPEKASATPDEPPRTPGAE